MYCGTTGPCFARKKNKDCIILQQCYGAGEKCPFQKEKQYYTNGIYYPHNSLRTYNKTESVESERAKGKGK